MISISDRCVLTVFLALGLLAGTPARADAAKVLRIITWADYVPAEVVAQFRKETGIQVEVSLSSKE
jgi:spermidine/putrescine transport system substrate-binding protein